MKRSTKYKLASFLCLTGVLFGYNQCISPMGGSAQKNSLKFSSTSSNSTNASSNVSRAVSLDAFSQSVYPITRAHCVACHGVSQTPMHAASDINVAFDAVINSSKVDFNNPANSRLVLKLRTENHNCWGDCAQNSSEMEAAVTKWKTLLGGTTGDVTNTNVNGKTTKDSVTVSEALNPKNGIDSGTVTLMAEASSLKTPMTSAAENGTSYVWTPSNAGVKDLTFTDAGTATLNFSVNASDFYKVFMYVNASSATSDSLYAKISGSNYKDWTIGATTGFQWKELTNTPQQLETDFYLSGGKPYQIELRQKEPGVKVSKVVVTNDLAYDPNAMAQVNQKATISVPIADISGVADSYFDIDIEIFDVYSYKLTNPRIRSTKDMKIKTVKVLVNGSFNPQHSTYLAVNKTITTADPTVSPYSMILLKDKGPDYDKLSFSFDVIEAAVK